MTPRHPPRALRSLTTPIGPPRPGHRPEPVHRSRPHEGRVAGGPCPRRRLATRPEAESSAMIVIRKGSDRPRATRVGRCRISFTDVNCSVESATHLSRGPRARRPSDHTQVNDSSCVTNHRIVKDLRPSDRPALVGWTFPAIVPWAGQGARPCAHGPAPRPGEDGRSYSSQGYALQGALRAPVGQGRSDHRSVPPAGS
jgi:hypothetical protein